MFNKKPFQQFEKKPEKKQERICKRVIQRDKEGRVKQEKFIGCKAEEIRIMKGESEND